MRTASDKRGKVTREHEIEAERLLKIWLREKPRLASLGFGSQEAFGEKFNIGNQAAVGFFLNGKSALSLKAAIGFAKGLGCDVGDFSPRLAAMLDPGGTDQEQKPPNEPGEAADATTINIMRLLPRLSQLDRERLSILLATVVDSGLSLSEFVAWLQERYAPTQGPAVDHQSPAGAGNVAARQASQHGQR